MGLNPEEVSSVIKKELEKSKFELDWVARWVDEEIVVTGEDGDRLPTSDYYSRYTEWCEEIGAPEKKLKALNDSLYRLGHNVRGPAFKVNGRVSRGWKGAKLKKQSFKKQIEEIVENDPEFGGGNGNTC